MCGLSCRPWVWRRRQRFRFTPGAWLLSRELPEGELSPTYHAELNPTGVGIPFRDVIDVAGRYPDRFIPGTTFDPRDPYAHDKLKAAVEIHGVRVFGEFKRRLRYDDPDVIDSSITAANSALTALSRDRGFTRKFLIDYQDRCFFARDDFSSRLYDFLLSLDLPQDALAKILAGNALRLVPV
ncbi:MAG: hypothetical protein HYV75_07870 [Opitutae bacterium]|nr:hypothetical protein [Opitutae bacterium]